MFASRRERKQRLAQAAMRSFIVPHYPPQHLGEALAVAKVPRLYVCFSMSTDMVSRMIADYTRSDVSHVFLAWWSGEFATVLTLGCNSNGLTVETLARFVAQGHSIPYIFTAPNLWIGARKHADIIDCPYDWGGLVGMGIVETYWALTKRWIDNPLTWKGALFCSCYATMVCRDSGYNDVLSSMLPASVAPGILKDALLAQPAPWVRRATLDGCEREDT